MQFRKKPVVVDAILWDGKAETLAEIVSFVLPRKATLPLETAKLTIETLEGNMIAEVGDMIIKGVNGECYPCKPDIFAKTYEPVSAPLLREAAADMTVQDFYSGFNLDFMSEEEKQTIYTATELFAKGKVRGAVEEKEREIRELKKQMKNKDERWEESCRHWMSKANDRLKIIEAVESLALSRSQTLTAISGDEILKILNEVK